MGAPHVTGRRVNPEYGDCITYIISIQDTCDTPFPDAFNQEQSVLVGLPKEILARVLDSFGTNSVCVVRGVCKALYSLCIGRVAPGIKDAVAAVTSNLWNIPRAGFYEFLENGEVTFYQKSVGNVPILWKSQQWSLKINNKYYEQKIKKKGENSTDIIKKCAEIYVDDEQIGIIEFSEGSWKSKIEYADTFEISKKNVLMSIYGVKFPAPKPRMRAAPK